MAALPGMANLQSGLLDPIPLFTRSVNLLLLPIAQTSLNLTERFYRTALPILAVFMIFTALNFLVPRFFCLFICPLGALFGILNRFAIFRINRNSKCTDCKMCNKNCTGNCQPSETIKQSECLMCMNCLDDCKFDAIDYSTVSSKNMQISPDISRRGFLAASFTGLMAVPALKLAKTEADSTSIIRPPGALPEKEFIKRCIKCGQCMKLCPTNVIQPAGLDAGLTNLWTPTMNNRIGTSGCQLDCVACGFVCPTAAIRPLTLAEKLGKGKFAVDGPVKIGTAAFDRSKCLPWAHNTPCIVCQENCPVSPKAIYTKEVFVTVLSSSLDLFNSITGSIKLKESVMIPDKFATGDYYCLYSNNGNPVRKKIISNTADEIVFSPDNPPASMYKLENEIQIQVRLQRPYVNSSKCIGCGICQHECPLTGKGAVIVSAYGQTREK